MVATQPREQAISCLEPTAQLLPVSGTMPAPRGPGVKQGTFSSGVWGSTIKANARLGFGSGMAKGDAETGAVPSVGTASAGGAGVDRVVLAILSRIS